MSVTCAQCADFEPPPPMYEIRSLGQCRSFVAGVARINREQGRKPNRNEWDAAMRARGSKLFFGTADRYCQLFTPKADDSAQSR